MEVVIAYGLTCASSSIGFLQIRLVATCTSEKHENQFVTERLECAYSHAQIDVSISAAISYYVFISFRFE